VLEVVWHLKNGRTEPKVDDCELPAIMGACYFMPRLWYLELAPLKNLRAWGCDELSLSLSAWLSGGDVRFMRNVRIGHKFNSGKVPMWQQFGIDPHWPVWNKLFGIKTLLFPDTVSEKYERLLWAHTTADIQNRLMILLRNHLHTIETTRAENRKRFKRDMAWFCGKFGLPL